MIEERKIVELDYVNHRGERTTRRVRPLDLKYHDREGWVLQAIDLTHVPDGETSDCAADRVRCFPLSGVIGPWRSAMPPDGAPVEIATTPTREPGNRHVPVLTCGTIFDAVPAPPADLLAWHRDYAQKMADDTGEAHLVFPEGLRGVCGEGPRLPCVVAESQVDLMYRGKGERIEPAKKEQA